MNKENPLVYLQESSFPKGNGEVSMIDPNQRYTITSDWFSAILSAEINLVAYDAPLEEYIYDSGQIFFKKMRYSAPMFTAGYEIILRGKMFAKVHVSPKKNGVLKCNQMQFELENNVQYEIGWLNDFKYLLSVMRWNVCNVSRVDIALDGKGFFEMWKLYDERKIQRVGAAHEQVFARASGGNRIITGFDVGRRASDKWITCYCKSDEIKKSNKDYIEKYWERSGLDTTHVERLELKLRNAALKEIKFDWTRLDDFEYLASVFRTFVDGGYVDYIDESTGELFRKYKRGILNFVIASGDTNVTRKKKINYIDWNVIGAEKLERFSTQKSNEVWAMKVTCKRLCLLAYSIKDKFPQRSENFLNEAHEVAKNINCLKWLIDRYDKWIREFSMMKLDYLPDYTLNTIKESRRMMDLTLCNPMPPDLFFVRM